MRLTCAWMLPRVTCIQNKGPRSQKTLSNRTNQVRNSRFLTAAVGFSPPASSFAFARPRSLCAALHGTAAPALECLVTHRLVPVTLGGSCRRRRRHRGCTAAKRASTLAKMDCTLATRRLRRHQGCTAEMRASSSGWSASSSGWSGCTAGWSASTEERWESSLVKWGCTAG